VGCPRLEVSGLPRQCLKGLALSLKIDHYCLIKFMPASDAPAGTGGYSKVQGVRSSRRRRPRQLDCDTDDARDADDTCNTDDACDRHWRGNGVAHPLRRNAPLRTKRTRLSTTFPTTTCDYQRPRLPNGAIRRKDLLRRVARGQPAVADAWPQRTHPDEPPSATPLIGQPSPDEPSTTRGTAT
jgi:hypothetical protein